MSDTFFVVARSSTLFDDFRPYYLVLIFLKVKKAYFSLFCLNFIYMFQCLLLVLFLMNFACIDIFVFSSMLRLKGE